jgi:hypothetical protein
MPLAVLLPHPSSPAPEFSLRVSCTPQAGGGLELSYRLTGKLAKLAIPPRQPAPERRDELWRQTCFEAFLRVPGETAYREYNFSPSGDWAIYQFRAYRQTLSSPTVITPPHIHLSQGTGFLQLDVELTPELLGATARSANAWHIGLSAVMDAQADGISYWALNHPPGSPDFHHDDGFALRLAP